MTLDTMLHTLLHRYGGALHRIARVYGAPTGEVEDLHQEILWQLWRALPAFRGDADAGTWLYRVALNTALTWKRRGERRDTTALLHERRPDASHGAPRSEAALLEEFLAALGDLDRSILLLYLEGLAYQAIADVTGIAAGTVGVRLHRIKRTFHDRYMED